MSTFSRNLAASAATLVLFVCGCVFDRSGTPGYDGRAETALDSTVDIIVDGPPDQPLPNPCATQPKDNVCRAQTANGQSGTCNGNQFDETSPFIRNCFADAPCFNGTCYPYSPLACVQSTCDLSEPGKVCTALFIKGKEAPLHGCVEPTPDNGNGGAADSCNANSDCNSGLCTSQHNCYRPCVSAGDCPAGAGLVCGSVTVQEGTKKATLSGCVFKPDGGVLEQGVLEQGVPEQGVPEQGVPEQGVPEQGVPEQGVPEQGVPEQGVPDQAVDAGADALIDVSSPDVAPPDVALLDLTPPDAAPMDATMLDLSGEI